jgi:hypothetical protein
MTRTFPKLEAIFEPEHTEPFLRRVEQTCRQLTQIAASGTPAEKARAAAALSGFTHAVNLVKELGELRFKMAEEATSSKAGR